MNPPSTSPARPTPWLELSLLFLGSRALIALLGWATPLVIARGRWYGAPSSYFSVFTRWDVAWYVDVARSGYFIKPDGSSTAAFFPLFPMLMRGLGSLLRSFELAGFLISNLALFASAALLWRITEEMTGGLGGSSGSGDGGRAARLLFFGPVSLFFSLPYSEATFLFFMLAGFQAARRRVWWLAGLLGAAAALTRNSGALLTAPLLCEFFEVKLRRPFVRREVCWRQLVWCFLPVVAFGAWAFALGRYLDEPMILLNVQKGWNRQLSWPWHPFQPHVLATVPPFYRIWFVGHAVGGVTLLLASVWMRIRLSLIVLAALLLTLDFSATHLEAIPRYVSVIFPFYLTGALLIRRWPALEGPALGCSAALLSLSTVLFVNGYWFT